MNNNTITSKQHELYVQFINTKSSIVPIPVKQRMRKRCGIAATRDNNISQKERNLKVEVAYMQLLANAKKLFVQVEHPVFERDYRRDNSESALIMYAFLNNSFYCLLECEFTYSYRIEYAFCNCPFERELRAVINAFPIGTKPIEIVPKPDFTTFYHNVLKVQDSRYITY